MLRILIAIFGLYFLFLPAGWTQCSTLGQTPATAFPVCGSNTFSQAAVPDCVNGSIFVNCPSNGNSYQDLNPYWYKFTCFRSGSLILTIHPNDLSDDYDWMLFDVTNLPVNDVYTADPTLASAIFVACNWSGVPGVTGTSFSYHSLIECGSIGPPGVVPTSPPPFSEPPQLVQGHNYLMMISHFSGSQQSGYSLSFVGGSASITDTLSPQLKSASISCDAKTISVILNKKMKCSSVATDGSDFTLGGFPASIISETGYNCNGAFDMDTVLLTLNQSLPAGNYTLTAQIGTDGNTLLDVCDRQVPVGSQLQFSVKPIQPTPLDSLSPVGCAPATLELVFSKPILCSSIAADGSDFVVTGSYPVRVSTAAGSNCASGTSNRILLTLSAPLDRAGNFQLRLVNGSDGNTIIDECGQETPAGSSISFFTADTVSAQFTAKVELGCVSDTIAYSQSGKNGINSWIWTFDSGASSRDQNPQLIYTVFGTKTASLVVSNGQCSASASMVIPLDNTLKAGFTAPGVVCPKDAVDFTNTSVGSVVSWLWEFGDGNTSFQQTPPSERFPFPGEVDKVYTVTLTAQNSMGCRDTASLQITALHTCIIAVPNAFTPNGDGINDYLYPLNAYKAVDLEFKVFNRYGQLVFETRDWTHKWDGTLGGIPQATGTYVWMLQYTDGESGKRYFLKGASVLIR